MNHNACTSRRCQGCCSLKRVYLYIRLLVYSYAKYKPTKEWYMRIDANKFATIKSIVEYLRSYISVSLPQIHALTSSATTSYLFNVTKTKVLKRVQENMNSLFNIKNLGNSTVLEEGAKGEIFKFIQRICYDGKETESLTELRVRLYRKMKTKSSQNMPADKYSLEQHILRAHYQTWIWMHVNVKIIPDVDLQEYGWTKMVDEELSETYVTPLWYKSKSFHRSLCIRLVRTSIFQA